MKEMFKLLLFMSKAFLRCVTRKRVEKIQKGKLDEDGEIHRRQSLSTSLFCLLSNILKKIVETNLTCPQGTGRLVLFRGWGVGGKGTEVSHC